MRILAKIVGFSRLSFCFDSAFIRFALPAILFLNDTKSYCLRFLDEADLRAKAR
jgi:hypothetical protein